MVPFFVCLRVTDCTRKICLILWICLR
ncbi:hypothetical protein PanWU01x14_360570 [Parasponia andersonii]|uniref:Uncharacterized protein n=1 Tax=Parasponia andersonii TaxID=3476 RepID=A0A2P5A7K7_PARAD|nr:hypothetical protein PanWU01x14_360570 [Parasponia andersonii]